MLNVTIEISWLELLSTDPVSSVIERDSIGTVTGTETLSAVSETESLEDY